VGQVPQASSEPTFQLNPEELLEAKNVVPVIVPEVSFQLFVQLGDARVGEASEDVPVNADDGSVGHCGQQLLWATGEPQGVFVLSPDPPVAEPQPAEATKRIIALVMSTGMRRRFEIRIQAERLIQALDRRYRLVPQLLVKDYVNAPPRKDCPPVLQKLGVETPSENIRIVSQFVIRDSTPAVEESAEPDIVGLQWRVFSADGPVPSADGSMHGIPEGNHHVRKAEVGGQPSGNFGVPEI
jgi:hypothetical protein